MSLTRKSLFRTALFAGVAALGLAGAHEWHHLGSQQALAQTKAAAPVAVSVQTVKAQDVQIWSSYSGRLHAVDFAEIRPQVSGRIAQLKFADGQMVRQGDVLLVIDPQPYEAALAKAKANLASAETNAVLAKANRERAANLVKSQFVAQQVYDERLNADHVAQAAIQSAKAEIRQAEIDLDHAYVKAPISGRLSRAEITVGNLVQAGPNAPLLTSIVSSDGIYADFEVDEQTYLSAIRHGDQKAIPVELALSGDPGHAFKGNLQSFDNRIDTASGTIRARARFANEDGSLVPGMFVSVRMAGGNEGPVLLIPERAIGSDQNKKFVLIVGADSKVAYRSVALGAEVAGSRIVLGGLTAGDRVIVDGLQHVRPDQPVAVSETVASN